MSRLLIDLALWVAGVAFVASILTNLALIGISRLYRRIRRRRLQKRNGIRLVVVPGMKRGRDA